MFRAVGFALTAIYALNLINSALAADSRQNPDIKVKTISGKYLNETTVCGPLSVVAKQVEICAKPLVDILQGTVEKWPDSENDISNLCTEFIGSEKCIRETGRKCSKGVHKIIISTLATSIQRARKRECTKPKYPSLLKTVKCIEGNQLVPNVLIANATTKLSVIENQMPNLDQKVNAVCCLVIEIESEMRRLLKPLCPNEASVMIKLYRAVVEDVLDLVCTAPKCKNLYRNYKMPQINYSYEIGGIIASLLRIIFSLGD